MEANMMPAIVIVRSALLFVGLLLTMTLLFRHLLAACRMPKRQVPRSSNSASAGVASTSAQAYGYTLPAQTYAYAYQNLTQSGLLFYGALKAEPSKAPIEAACYPEIYWSNYRENGYSQVSNAA
jgi:hypothetical protein